ncbi:MAG: GNAT family N-acetyltransferase [Candidatus Bipolaricaulia bacterium]
MASLHLTVRDVEREETEEFRSREWRRYDEEVGVTWDSRHHYLAAELEGLVVGIAHFHIVGGVGHLDQLLVSKDYRSRGIGAQLLNEFERRCRAAGCHKLTLETAEYQAPEFYKKHGFKIACTMRDNKFHHIWYLMEKELQSCLKRS